MMIQQTATILWNRLIGPRYYQMGLACSRGYASVQPGQFVTLRIGSGFAPLLRRPFSVSGRIGPQNDTKGIELLYKVVGPGTGQLAQLKPNQTLDILGPLGRGFQVRSGPGPFYLVAGGIGVAPIRFLAHQMKTLGIDMRACHLFLGGQGDDDLLCQQDFEALGMPVTVTTDDGSAGDQCLITDPLELAVRAQKPTMVFACGPHGMLECVAGIVSRHAVACQISTETLMACGMGACLGCALKSRQQNDRYLHACLDGPVFDASELCLSGDYQ
jgi:dihydroorotate dehydrogenase electron transfer subunit